MANTSSIAGRAHGATPAAPKPQTGQYRPQLTGLPGVHPEVARAIQNAFDNLYSLRNEVQAMQAKPASGSAPTEKSGGKDAKTGEAKGFTDNLSGIKIKAVTDPSSLQNGMVLKYNSSSGQWEPSM